MKSTYRLILGAGKVLCLAVGCLFWLLPPGFAGGEGGSDRDGETSRFGIDYVFPLALKYQTEIIPEKLAETGAGWVNFARVQWKNIEPEPPRNGDHRYRWDDLDRAVRAWQKHGFRIVVSLRLGGGWFAGPMTIETGQGKKILGRLLLGGTDRLPRAENREDFRAWIGALVERYDGDGENDMPGLLEPVLHYQVGNEYGNPLFWTGTVEDYLVLLDDAYRVAKQACPGVKIIPNGLRWNDFFHDNPRAEKVDERFEAFLSSLNDQAFRDGWRRNRRLDEAVLARAELYDIVDAGTNGPWHTTSEGYYTWTEREMAKSGKKRPIWDMESRCEPILIARPKTDFHTELEVSEGRETLRLMKVKSRPGHEEAVRWYRAEQARVLVRVFASRFAAGFEKVFMGMPDDWDRSLGSFMTLNPYLGLLDADSTPWPAFYALKLMVKKVDGFAAAEERPGGAGVKLYRFTFGSDRAPVWVAWLEDAKPRGMNDPIPSRKVRLKEITGPVTVSEVPTADRPVRVRKMKGGPDGIELTLTPTPVFIEK